MADGSRTGSAPRHRAGRTRHESRAKPNRLEIDIVLPPGMRAPGLAGWLQSVAPPRARGTVALAVVPDARVRSLNRQYREKDQNTDVLSFPADDAAGLTRPAPRSRDADRRGPAPRGRGADRTGPAPRSRGAGLVRPAAFLGDIVIAAGVARRQAREASHSLQTELRILALHGLLHLLGYDHEQDSGQMARLERRLRRQGGLRAGLIERAEPAPSAFLRRHR